MGPNRCWVPTQIFAGALALVVGVPYGSTIDTIVFLNSSPIDRVRASKYWNRSKLLQVMSNKSSWRSYYMPRNVGSHTGVINDKRSIRQLRDTLIEFDQWVLLEPSDLWWRVTCDHWAAQDHPAWHAHCLSFVLTVEQHLRRHYNTRMQFITSLYHHSHH